MLQKHLSVLLKIEFSRVCCKRFLRSLEESHDFVTPSASVNEPKFTFSKERRNAILADIHTIRDFMRVVSARAVMLLISLALPNAKTNTTGTTTCDYLSLLLKYETNPANACTLHICRHLDEYIVSRQHYLLKGIVRNFKVRR